MRRILALLLTVVMALSLVVVASAANEVDRNGKTTLKVALVSTKSVEELVKEHATELTYEDSLIPTEGTKIGAAQFTLTAPEGTTFKTEFDVNEALVYNSKKADNPKAFGSEGGIFDIDAISSKGPVGGSLESDNTFKAILAGTVPPDRPGFTERMMTTGAWVYRLTISIPGGMQENVDYKLTIGNDPAIGWDDGKNGVNHRHTVEPDNPSVMYSTFKKGDVNGDGKINIRDVNKMYDHFNGISLLTGDEFVRGDINNDGKINIRDVNGVVDHYNGVKLLW